MIEPSPSSRTIAPSWSRTRSASDKPGCRRTNRAAASNNLPACRSDAAASRISGRPCAYTSSYSANAASICVLPFLRGTISTTERQPFSASFQNRFCHGSSVSGSPSQRSSDCVNDAQNSAKCACGLVLTNASELASDDPADSLRQAAYALHKTAEEVQHARNLSLHPPDLRPLQWRRHPRHRGRRRTAMTLPRARRKPVNQDIVLAQ